MSPLPVRPSPDADTPIYDDLVRAIAEFDTVGDQSDTPSETTERAGQHRR